MTATYVPAQLSSNTTYQIRMFLGDTDLTNVQLQDEELAWAYSERGNVWGATALCALALSARYSRLTNISADGVSQQLSQKAAQLERIAEIYQRKECIYRGMPFVYGVSKSDMLATLANSDRVPDIFRLGLSDDPPTLGISPTNSPALGTDDVADGDL